MRTLLMLAAAVSLYALLRAPGAVEVDMVEREEGVWDDVILAMRANGRGL